MSELVLRAPSVAAGMTLVLMGGLFVWKWTESGALGVLASFLIAIDPHSVFFSQEARAYALVQLVALLQVASFARLAVGEPNRLSRIGWIGLTWVLFYLHYTSLLILLGEVVFGLVSLCYGWTRRGIRAWAVDLFCISVGLVPAIAHVQEIATRRDNWSKFILPPSLPDLLNLLRFDAFLLAPLALLGLFATVSLARGQRWNVERSTVRRILLLACWTTVPLVVAWAMTRTGVLHVFFRRYLISVAVAPMLLAGLLGDALSGVANRRGYALLSALTAAALILPLRPVSVGGVTAWHGLENWRDAIAAINDRSELSHLPVLVRSGLIEDDGLRDPQVSDELVEFCLLPVQSLYRFEQRDGVVEPLPGSRSWELSSQQITRLKNAGGAWLIVRGLPNDATRLGQNFRRWLKQHGVNVSVEIQHFGNVSVLLLRA